MISITGWVFSRQNGGQWRTQTIGGRISLLIERHKHSDGFDYQWHAAVNWGDGLSDYGSCETVAAAKKAACNAVIEIYEQIFDTRRERES